MRKDPPHDTENLLLQSLTKADKTRLWPKLERVELVRGQVLHRAGDDIKHVYFPERSMISIIASTESGQTAEVAVIGSEGASGIDVIMGTDQATNEHVAQIDDVALRIKTSDVRDECKNCGDLQAALLQFTRRLMGQISQTALCNRLHTVDKRLSRWLLMSHDRASSDRLNLTQEFIAVMLGANRTTVTTTAIELQNLGFISYSRGSLTIVDRPGLEAFTCSCYEIIREAYEQ